jgi:hypothetical protein
MSDGVSLELAQAAKPKALQVFQDLVGDAAVGIMPLGRNTFGLKVNLKTTPQKGVELPSQIEGVPVKVDVVGTIRKR